MDENIDPWFFIVIDYYRLILLLTNYMFSKSIKRFKKLFVGHNVKKVNNILGDPNNRLRRHCYISGFNAGDTERCHRVLLRMKTKPFYELIWTSSTGMSRNLLNDNIKYINYAANNSGAGIYVLKAFRYNYRMILFGTVNRYERFVNFYANNRGRNINLRACRECLEKYIAKEPLITRVKIIIGSCIYCEMIGETTVLNFDESLIISS